MKKKLVILLVFLTGILTSSAQYTLSGDDGTTIYASTGDIYLGSYIPDEMYEVTICSNNPMCSHITISFDTWTIGSGNYCVYDGNTSASYMIGCNTWGVSQIVGASVSNSSGCLTIQFMAPSTGSLIGGQIGCQFMCQPVLSSVISTDPPAVFEDGAYYLDVCQDQEISLQAAGIYQNTTYTQSDATSIFSWDMGDDTNYFGSSVSHTYSGDDGFDIFLSINDVAGCGSTNYLGYRVRVSRQPVFSGTIPSPSVICQGDIVSLTGVVQSEEFVSLVEPVFADTTYIPDGGDCYSDTLFYDYFEPGQILEDIDDFCGVYAIMEHSFLGDLVISITCPNNVSAGGPVTVILESQHGGGTHIGEPIDDYSGGGPGIGWEYGWVNPWDADYLPDMGHVASSYPTLPSGTYGTTEPLDPLVGCDLNGNWIITVCDYWSIDDGYIFSWWLCFDPSIMPESWSYQNNYPTQTWAAELPNGSMLSSNTGTYNGTGIDDTSQPFYFSVTDDFGCQYDTTVMVFVRSDTAAYCCVDPVVNITTANQDFCGSSIALSAGSFHIPGNTGEWTASPSTGVDFSTPNSPNTSVTISSFGSYTFTWTEVNNGSASCTSSDNVTINFQEQPIVNAGLDIEQCGNIVNLNAGILPVGATGYWSSSPALLPSAYTDGDITSSVTSVTIPGFSETIAYEFLWTVNNGECSGADQVKVFFFETPNPDAGSDTTVCGSIFDLNVTNIVGEGQWTVFTTTGEPVEDVIFIDSDNPLNHLAHFLPNPQVNIAMLGSGITLVFQWNEFNGQCYGDDQVEVTFTVGPYAYAGNDNFVCGDSIQLNADITGVEAFNGYWTCEHPVDFYSNEWIFGINNDHDGYVAIPESLEDLYINGIAEIDLIWNMDNGACTSSDIVTMTFYEQPEANAGRDTFVCGQTFTFQAEQSVDTSIGTWEKISGDGTPVYSSATYLPATRDPHATVTVTVYDEYVFQWTESNPFNTSCNTSDLIHVTFVPVPTELDAGNDTVFCQTDDDQYIAQLNATGGFGTGVWHSTISYAYSYVNQMNPTTQVTSNHPGMETFCWRETVPSGFSQPCVVEKCVDITFEPTPNVTLLSGDDWVCGPEYVTINGHVIDADTAYWFDASHAGTQFINNTTTNPINVNDTVQVSIYGHHQIYLIAENQVQIGSYTASCRDTAEVLNIAFYEWPTPTVIPADTACGLCYNLEGFQSMDSTAVTWSALSPSGITFSSTGTIVGNMPIDTVCVAITDTTRTINFTEYYPYQNRCGVSTTILVKFAEIPDGLYDFTAPVCFGAEWLISAREDSLPYYEWEFGDAGDYVIDSVILNAATGEYENIVHWVDGDTMHIVDVVLTSSYGCNSPIFRDTLNEPPINYAAQNLSHETCGDENGWVIIQGEGGLAPDAFHELSWMNESIGDVEFNEGSILVENLPAGTYWVEITDIYDCNVLDTIQILNTGLIDAVIDILQFTLIDDGEHHGIVGDASAEIPLISLTEDARFYRWYIYTDTDSLVFGPFTGQIQSYEFLADGDYKIVLEVESREGCVDTTNYMYISIMGGSYIEIPNIFTPNGDGINDVFQVHANALRTFEGTILNRWGKTMYEWDNWTSPNSGWDGTINGESVMASPGVYYYIVKATGIDNNKTFEMKGALHLVREK